MSADGDESYPFKQRCSILLARCERCPFECTYSRPMCHAYASGYCYFSDKDKCARGWHIPLDDYTKSEKAKSAKRKKKAKLITDLRRIGLGGSELPEPALVHAAYKRTCVQNSEISFEQKAKKARAYKRLLRRSEGKEEGSLESDSAEAPESDKERQ